jgi:hypothetical protein
MIGDIKWSKLSPYNDDRRKSFEELCYQIAKGLYEGHGVFTDIDDTGGGDGVEFYVTLPNGDQWGWQAKFYKPGPEGRLAEGKRKGQIVDSLKKACEKHSRLKKWFLWTPLTFTEKEREWFETKLKTHIPDTHHELELIHHGEGDFLNWFRMPRFSGIRLFFFGELELTLDWFQRRFNETISQIGDKYVSGLHVEMTVESTLHALIADGYLVEEFSRKLRAIEDKFSSFKDAKRRLYLNEPPGIEWGNQKQDLINTAEQLQYNVELQITSLWQIFRCLNEQRLDLVKNIKSQLNIDEIRNLCHAYGDASQKIDIKNIPYSGPQNEQDELKGKAFSIIDQPGSSAFAILWELKDLVKRLTWFTQSELHILGDAHQGKTHVVTNFCREHLELEGPALLLSGKDFRTNDPLNIQLLKLIGVPANYGWDDFLGALDSAAAAYRTRIPIIIDGLNEAVVDGRFSQIWEQDLTRCVQSLAEFENIVLVTTCRSTYANIIWSKMPERFIAVEGFDWNKIEFAVQTYFQYYKIDATLRESSLPQFRDPIHLRIFCETVNPDRSQWKKAHIGSDSIIDIFHSFVNEKNRILCKKFDRYQNLDLLTPALTRLGQKLWETDSRTIPFTEFPEIIDQKKLEELEWENSFSKALLDEGLLIARDMTPGGETVSFTYDTMAGYFVANYLISESDFSHTAWKQRILDRLFHQSLAGHGSYIKGKLDKPWAKNGMYFYFRTPLAEDIIDCLITLMIMRKQIYFHHVFPELATTGFNLKSLFDLSPRNAPDSYVSEVSSLFEDPSTRFSIFNGAKRTMGAPEHPLNAEFWSGLLARMLMPERDAYWTEFVRQETSWAEHVIGNLEQHCRDPKTQTANDEEYVHLLATQTMWFLTSTVRWLRDLATRALYWYGRRFPSRLFEITLDSIKINDPYISERTIAAAYGIAMAKSSGIGDSVCSNDILRNYARKLFAFMFAEGASHSTTHILTRDYAVHTIEIALSIDNHLLCDAEHCRIISPFGAAETLQWQEIEDPSRGHLRPYDDPMKLDFANYTIGSLVDERSPYEDSPKYREILQQIRWRIFNLGYSMEIFGEIDDQIRRENSEFGRSANGGKIDRYGKKYSWIAFYEMAGTKADQGLLPNYENGERFVIDIDPSFPDDQPDEAVILIDILGNRESTLDEWIDNGRIPDLSAYFIGDELQAAKGPWILLDGYLSQQDEQAHRKVFVFLRGLVVSSDLADSLVGDLTAFYVNANGLPRPSRDRFFFAGEIPWRYGTNHNGITTLETILPNGQERANYEAILPVLSNEWGSGVSYSNPGRDVYEPARELTERLGLLGVPQTFNLIDTNGELAILNLASGSHLYSKQSQCYIRKDLLERYLVETGTELILMVWGEREAFFDNDSDFSSFVQERRNQNSRAWGAFHTVHRSSNFL